eukprot:TRINITY_DN9190_c1_g4_i1.p1 TRINITY_DN9190_c1_g4~~TRINITY_DN9190_c1_g4_i1.p1  ORF type:complete len:120 (+),score=31.87 TRINITY_DN9190_c1_g4_i1:38-397(+)
MGTWTKLRRRYGAVARVASQRRFLTEFKSLLRAEAVPPEESTAYWDAAHQERHFRGVAVSTSLRKRRLDAVAISMSVAAFCSVWLLIVHVVHEEFLDHQRESHDDDDDDDDGDDEDPTG